MFNFVFLLLIRQVLRAYFYVLYAAGSMNFKLSIITHMFNKVGPFIPHNPSPPTLEQVDKFAFTPYNHGETRIEWVECVFSRRLS